MTTTNKYYCPRCLHHNVPTFNPKLRQQMRALKDYKPFTLMCEACGRFYTKDQLLTREDALDEVRSMMDKLGVLEEHLLNEISLSHRPVDKQKD